MRLIRACFRQINSALIPIYISIRASLAERRPVLALKTNGWWRHYFIFSVIPPKVGVWISRNPSLTPIFALSENLPLFLRTYNIKKGDVIVDVGSGTGSELAAFSQMVGDGGVVYGFEAHLETFAQAIHTLEVSNLKNTRVFNLAAWDSNDYVLISDEDSDTSNSIMKNHGIPVKSIKLGEFLLELLGERPIDFLKMNIEGAETKALLGLLSHTQPRHLCISCHDFLEVPELRTHSEVLAILEANGYVIHDSDITSNNAWEKFYIFATLENL